MRENVVTPPPAPAASPAPSAQPEASVAASEATAAAAARLTSFARLLAVAGIGVSLEAFFKYGGEVVFPSPLDVFRLAALAVAAAVVVARRPVVALVGAGGVLAGFYAFALVPADLFGAPGERQAAIGFLGGCVVVVAALVAAPPKAWRVSGITGVDAWLLLIGRILGWASVVVIVEEWRTAFGGFSTRNWAIAFFLLTTTTTFCIRESGPRAASAATSLSSVLAGFTAFPVLAFGYFDAGSYGRLASWPVPTFKYWLPFIAAVALVIATVPRVHRVSKPGPEDAA